MNWKIPYFELQLGEEERQAAVDVINSNWLTSGPKIQEFENLFSENFHNSLVQSLAVANCTVGLHLAVKVLGIGKDDEVICPSLNCSEYDFQHFIKRKLQKKRKLFFRCIMVGMRVI